MGLGVFAVVRKKAYVYGKKFMVQAERPEETTEAVRKVYEELKKQNDMKGLQLSLHEEMHEGKSMVLRTSRWMREDMKLFCQNEGLGLT